MDSSPTNPPLSPQDALLHAYAHGERRFSEVVLPNVSLTDTTLQGAELHSAVFTHSDLSRANLRMANLTMADLAQANLHEADLRLASLEAADLRGANLRGANLQGADLCTADLKGANLQNTDLCMADLRGANLKEANLTGATYNSKTRWPFGFSFSSSGAVGPNANLQGHSMEGRDLRMADLSRANLQNTDLRSAVLVMADLQSSNLQGANLQEADLQRSNLKGANLQNTNLHNTNLTRAFFDAETLWPDSFDPSTCGAIGPHANLENHDLRCVNLHNTTLQHINFDRADLTESNLSETLLQHASLHNTNLTGALLLGTDLSSCSLKDITLTHARYDEHTLWPEQFDPSSFGAIGPGTNLPGHDLRGADLQGANLQHANLSAIHLSNAKLSEANLANANLSSAWLVETNLSHTDLQYANLSSASLHAANLQHANLSGTDLSGADLRGANLQGANLQGANLTRCLLFEADLSHAFLQDTNLSDAQLLQANLSHADLQDANLHNTDLRWTFLAGTNLHDTQGQPRGRERCLIDLQTYTRSQWDPRTLREWHHAGATISDLDTFPEEAHDALMSNRRGLTLRFNKRLSFFEQHLIHTLILCVLGTDTDCHIAEIKLRDQATNIRLDTQHTPDLEWLAETLSQRTWEQHTDDQSSQTHIAFQCAPLLQPSLVRTRLSLLIDKHLRRAELYAPANQGQTRRTWTLERYLPPNLLLELTKHTDLSPLYTKRHLLLQRLPDSITEQLPTSRRSSDQLTRDLHTLNRLPTLPDDTPPVLVWLQNAQNLSPHRNIKKALKHLKQTPSS